MPTRDLNEKEFTFFDLLDAAASIAEDNPDGIHNLVENGEKTGWVVYIATDAATGKRSAIIEKEICDE